MECLTGFASAIARDLVCEAVDELRHPCCFNNFAQDLEEEVDKLDKTRRSVQERVALAKKQTKKTEQVDEWLTHADTIAENAHKLLQEAGTNKKCCLGHCPNWCWRHRLGKQLALKKRIVKTCIEQSSNNTQIERLASLPGLGYFSSERCLKFESRQSAYEELMEALKGDEVTMIGLYGMGGCGKTTLAIEVGKRAEKEHFFQVLFVLVPSTVQVENIQDKIADQLELILQEKEVTQRAQRLYMRLKSQEKKILLILDDVWQRLDFENIGIPSSKNHKGCKVLITTRSEAVCTSMDCQRKILLQLLSDEEAWDLFQKQAHISEGTSNTIKHLARQISSQCKGLPVAIAAVASTLKGKAEDDWNAALDKLKRSIPVNIEKGLQNPYNCLRLSYDNLDTEEAKSLFFLCSVFPKFHEIPMEDLTRFAIGLGIVGEVHSYKGARNEVRAAKNKLIGSCLLSDADGGEIVEMHDLVRDVALLIEKNENKVIKRAKEKDVTVEYSSQRYLWREEFPIELDYSNIELLCISTYLEVTDEIFKGMGKLRVLVLVNKGLGRRPLLTTSYKFLTNLSCLCLNNWELSDISFVGDIKKLGSLTVHNCSFLELPKDVVVTQLTNLRLLHLSECDMERNPFEVIGRHPQLEELYIADPRSVWDVYNENTAEFFNKFSVPQALQRYGILLGTLFDDYLQELLNRHRTLFLSCFHTSNAAVKGLAKTAEVLYIAHIQGGAKNIIPDIVQIEGGGMNELIQLLIRDSEEIEYLVDTSNHMSEEGTLFSNLLWLRIEGMKHLRALCHGQPPSGLFEKLEALYLSNCPQLHSMLFVWNLNLCSLKVLALYTCSKLTSLFTPAVAQSLIQLEELKISDCDGLKYILADDEREEISTEDHRLVFPKLKRLHVRDCKKLEYIIPVTFAQGLVQLECLEIVSNPELKHVFGQCTHGDQLVDQSQKILKIVLPALKELKLAKMPNIISVFPENCYPTWPSLRQFDLQNCSKSSISKMGKQCDHSTTKELGSLVMHSSQIINKTALLQAVQNIVVENSEIEGILHLPAELATNRNPDLLTSYLKELHLVNLPELMYICKGPIQSMSLQNLEKVMVYKCNNLKCILSSCIAGGLPQLKELNIECCDKLEGIFEDVEHQELSDLPIESRQPEDCPKSTSNSSVTLPITGPFNQCNLKKLILRSCSMLRSLFSPSTAIILTSLEELMIAQCHELRYLVTYERADKNKEEIIQEDHDSQSYVSMFPRLERISVINCNLLEYIFHVSFAQGLKELKDIEIRQTRKLRYVFGQSIHDVHSSHRYQNKIQIELPALEKLALFSIPDMISICPDNYYATCSSLRRLVADNVGLSTLSINSLMVDSGATRSDHSSTMDIGAASTMKGKMLGSVAIWNSSKIKGIFHLDGFPINRRQVTSWLKDLNLVNLPELSYIWRGAKHFVTLQNLYKLYIWGCQKLKAIFSASVLRSLPQLKILVVLQCEELEQIIEEDKENENVSNPQSPKICFSKLKLLLVTHCNNLKRLFHLSASHEFPELEYLIINQDSHLEEVFEGKQGVREGRVEVLLPELRHVILMQLPNLNNISQGIEFQTLTNLLVHNCPKLSITSTTTAEDMLQNYYHDREINFFVRCDLLYIRDIINKETASKDPMPETTSQLQMSPEDQAASESELPSSQVNGTNQSMLRNLAGSVREHNQIESGVTESHEFLVSERKNKGTEDLQSLEQKLSPIPSPNLTEGIEKTETAIIGKVPASVKPAIPTSLATPLHKISSHNLVDQESISEPSFLDQRLELGETIVTTEVDQITITPPHNSIENIVEEAMTANLSAVVQGVGLDIVVATHPQASGGDMLAQYAQDIEQGDKPNEEESRTSPCQKIQNGVDSIQKGSNLMDKEGEIRVVSNDSIEAPPASADTLRSHLLIVAELGAFKHFVDLDDSQIALLAEAIAVYPHLWNVRGKFSVRFQAWMLKTLADMLFFLRNESAVSVTPEREKEFYRLCDEAVHLGLERSWVDEMRQRVMVRDPRVGHAQARLSELLKRQEQLTQKLCKIRGEIGSLNDFVDSQKKCFDFL